MRSRSEATSLQLQEMPSACAVRPFERSYNCAAARTGHVAHFCNPYDVESATVVGRENAPLVGRHIDCKMLGGNFREGNAFPTGEEVQIDRLREYLSTTRLEDVDVKTLRLDHARRCVATVHGLPHER
jgi:hypothetical protein